MTSSASGSGQRTSRSLRGFSAIPRYWLPWPGKKGESAGRMRAASEKNRLYLRVTVLTVDGLDRALR